MLHTPRQTGKTTALGALCNRLNGSGRYRCVYVNVEPAQTAREDVEDGLMRVFQEFFRDSHRCIKLDS